MPPQIFKNKIIAAAGPLPRQLTVENLKKWTELRRGNFVTEFDETVTHLLCTRDQFRDKRNPVIKKALQKRPGRRSVKVVHYEWYEFSAAYNEKIPEQKYLMVGREADRRAREREEKRWQKGLEAGIKGVNPNLHRVYYDRDNFRYQITLVHKDQVMGYIDEKYILTLWESNAKPHLYWFTAKLTKSNNGRHFFKPAMYRGSEHSIKWSEANKQFTTFFKKQCRIEWEDRVSHQRTQSTAFQYVPPTGGKPVGRRLRHSYEYCLEINAETRRELGIIELVEDDADDGGDEMEIDKIDDEDVDMLREELISEDEENGRKNGNDGGDDASAVSSELDEDGDESDGDDDESDDGATRKDCNVTKAANEEEHAGISTEDVAIQVATPPDMDVEKEGSSDIKAVQYDAGPPREAYYTPPNSIAPYEHEETLPSENAAAKEATDVTMSTDKDLGQEAGKNYPTPASMTVLEDEEEEEQAVQDVEEAHDAVKFPTIREDGDARADAIGKDITEKGPQQQQVRRERQKCPTGRKKLPTERKSCLPGDESHGEDLQE